LLVQGSLLKEIYGNFSPMALSVVGVTAPDAGKVLSSFSVMVEVDGDRAKALRGPKWVSLSSIRSNSKQSVRVRFLNEGDESARRQARRCIPIRKTEDTKREY
jgi:hypothetical protein